MELVPEVLLDFTHIAPGVHSIGLDISYLTLVILLNRLCSLGVLHKVGLLGVLDDDLGYFLGSLDLLHRHFVFESLLDDLRDGHVVDLLRGLELSGGNQLLLGHSFHLGFASQVSQVLGLVVGANFLAQLQETGVLGRPLKILELLLNLQEASISRGLLDKAVLVQRVMAYLMTFSCRALVTNEAFPKMRMQTKDKNLDLRPP